MRKLTILTAMLLLLPVVTQAESLEELLVEKGVITRSEMRASQHDGGAKVYWNKGTRLDFADVGFTVKLNTQLQTRYEFTDNDSDFGLDNESSFSVRRARLVLSGTALHEEFKYKVQTDFVGDSGEDGAREPDLRDAWIQWQACDWGGVQLGQFKTAVSRQENNGSAYLQFPERSEVSDIFSTDRQQGLRALLAGEEGDWELTAAVYNGESDGEGGIGGGRNRAGVDTRHSGDVSLRANLMGEMNPHVEGDVDRTEDMAINVGGAFMFSQSKNDLSRFGISPESRNEDTDIQRASVDFNLKSDGFSLHAEAFWMNVDNDAAADETDPVGGYVQAGMFVSENMEIAARYGYTDCDNGTTTGACIVEVGNADVNGIVDDLNEVAVSLNYYWWKHHLKAQFAYLFLNRDLAAGAPQDVTGETDAQDNRWIFQLSAYF